MTLSIAFPVAGMVGQPFLLAELLCDPVIRIDLELDSLPAGLSGPLARRLTAIGLQSVAWSEYPRAVYTGDQFHSRSPRRFKNQIGE